MSLGLRLSAQAIKFECGLVKPVCSFARDTYLRRCCTHSSCRSLCSSNNHPNSSLSCSRISLLTPIALQKQQVSQLCLSTHDRRMWRITMDDEEKKRKRAEIEKMKKEERPVGLFAKMKYYVKRYWYIAIPVHFMGSLMWFGGLYAAVRSGIDIVSLLEHLHLPESLIDRVKSTPPSAGVLVLTLILFKVASPLRYATTLAGIQIVFSTLKRMGKLPIAKEVEFEIRSKYESEMKRFGRRYHKYGKSGVRAIKRRSDDKH